MHWPEPMFVPSGEGMKLNPARAEFAFQTMKSELTIGEMFAVVDMILDGTGYAIGHAAVPTSEQDENAGMVMARCGDDLDLIGNAWGMPRKDAESDPDYRVRLLAKVRACAEGRD